jgi:peptide/nickel transport system ATP-binding protein
MSIAPVLEANALHKVYAQGRRLKSKKIALENVSVALFRGSTLALVGKSGSGKSTLARCLALLEPPDAGEIRFRGVNVAELRRRELKRLRPSIQLIWQHSALALNPALRVIDLVAEPLLIRHVEAAQRYEQALTMMSALGIPDSLADRTALQLSGGQRQRVAIARALILNPAVIIFDEALAGLDVPLQAQIASTLREVSYSLSLSYLFITHDLRMAASIADNIAVMEDGRIVESQSVRGLLLEPQNQATRELLASIPAYPIA